MMPAEMNEVNEVGDPDEVNPGDDGDDSGADASLEVVVITQAEAATGGGEKLRKPQTFP